MISEFERLVEEWKHDTRFMSSPIEKAAHPAYRRIISMGRPVLPLLLQELQREPNHWFTALSAITGENPVPEEARGRIGRMAQHWIDWAVERGIPVSGSI